MRGERLNTMIRIWPNIGVVLGVLAVGMALWQPPADAFGFALTAQFVALVFHQFEEYSLPGGFKEFYNHSIYGHSPITKYPLGSFGVYGVNIFWGWGLYGAAFLLPQFPLFGTGLAEVHIVNALAHVGLCLRMKAYNPGAVTSFVFLIPSGAWVLWLGLPLIETWQIALLILTPPLALGIIQGTIFLGAKLEPVSLREGK